MVVTKVLRNGAFAPPGATEIDGPHLRAVARSSGAVTDGCVTACVDRAPDSKELRVY